MQYRLDDLSIDLERQTVRRGDESLPVSGLSFRLLAHLLSVGTRVVSFDELIESVWSPALVNEDTVTQRIKLLRQALGDDSRTPRYLRSVRGMGYQLCSVPTAQADAATDDESIVATSTAHVVEAPDSAKPRHRRGLASIVVAVIALALVAAAFTWWRQDSTRPATDTDSTAPSDAREQLLQRARHYAAMGQYDNNERAIALFQQARDLDMTYVDAMIGLSRAYSARVCLYNQDPHWAVQALALAEEARTRAPADARTHVAIGYASDCLGRESDALTAYERALTLDPDDDAARASAAYLYERTGRLAEALDANLSVRNPEHARFLPIQIASNLELLGFHAAAEARFKRSFQLYPDSVFSNLAWPRFLFSRGRFTEAQAALDEAFRRRTDHSDLHTLAGELALVRGEHEQAATAFEHAATLRPHTSWPATLLALHGPTKLDQDALSAQAARLRDALHKAREPASSWLELALIEAATGQQADAMHSIAQAVENGLRDKDYLLVSTLFQDLRADPAFAAMIDRIGMEVHAQREQALTLPSLPAELRAALQASP